MKAIVYEGIKNVKVKDVEDPKIIDATDIITHRLSLDKGEHAYEIFDKKKYNCIKVILKP
jgi:threonine dehydrogenase-like Zn-dependent dehydrogenase